MKKEERPVDFGREENTTSHVGGDASNDAQTIVKFADSYVPCVAAHPLCCALELYSNSENSTSTKNAVCSQHLAMYLLRLKNAADGKMHAEKKQEADVTIEKLMVQYENAVELELITLVLSPRNSLTSFTKALFAKLLDII
jgi:hypothetical protein